ncbi:MAG: hypothetical protein JKY94_09825 [Rhodobacteraceae bacterium]|nr:hypothetical protein [Paracoccaceae bacterium]
MHKSLTVLLTAGLLLSSCGWSDSSVNPKNWFGSSKEIPVGTEAGDINPLIPKKKNSILNSKEKPVDIGIPIAKISQLRIERTSSGAIIHATGIGAREGVYGARLVPDTPGETPENGILSYTFRVFYPQGTTAFGTDRTRRVDVARSVSNQQMAGVRSIRVSGTDNAREARRR